MLYLRRSSPKSTSGDDFQSVVWMFDPVNDSIVGLPWLGVRYGITEEEKVKIGMAVSWRLIGKCLQELECLGCSMMHQSKDPEFRAQSIYLAE